MNNFFIQYYTKGVKKYFQLWINFLIFFWNFFSIGRFLKTLFSPWKKDVSRIYERGLHPILFLRTLTENTATRIIGAIVKICIIFIGIFMEIITILIFALIFPIFIIAPAMPFVLIISIILFFIGNSFFGAILLFLSLISFSIVVMSLISLKLNPENYQKMSLIEIIDKKWFKSIFDRIGLDLNEENKKSLINPKKSKELLRSIDITPEEFAQVINWEISNQIEKYQKRKFWSKENLLAINPIGRYWSYAYTNNLDKYSTDLSALSEHQNPHAMGRENEFNELNKLLTRSTQNKIIIVGEPGTGRDTLIKKLAKEIRDSHIDGPLQNKRLLELHVKEILTENSSNGTGEALLESLFKEATYAGNIILVLKDMHEYLSPEGKDISLIISQFLDYPTFQIIGTTTPENLHSKIEGKALLMKYFEKITLEEMNEENIFQTLLYKLEKIESRKILFTFQALREITKLSNRYITDSPSPEKEIDIMEEVLLHWENNPDGKLITVNTVNKAFSAKFNIPLGDIEEEESEKLTNLENHLHQQVIGQDTAVRQIAETMRRARVGMTQKNKPLGSFLFLGPTGVGKTESAKALARSYFGSEEKMIRIDMSEYQMQDSINRLIGSNQSKTQGHLTNKVKENPFSLLLLDEIEKAHPDILNLFLQVLDEGFLTDGFGKKINFSNLIIIATSNAGAEIISESIKNQLPPEEIEKKVINHTTKKGIFRPEFLNRFEAVVFFNPLTQEETIEITKLLLKKYAKRLEEQRNVKVSFEEGLAKEVALKSYEPEFGARSIDRYIKDKIEDMVVKKMISKEIQKGTDFVLKISDLEID